MSNWLQYGVNWLFSEFLTHLWASCWPSCSWPVCFAQRRSPSSTIAWLLVILIWPYVGVPLYIMFGGRKIHRMARKKKPIYHPTTGSHGDSSHDNVGRLLASYGVPPATAGNRVELVTSGVDAYERVMRHDRRRPVRPSTSPPTSLAATKGARPWSIC